MSGGLLALSKYWWEKTGGYDDKMQAWGGENLDQSLRTWLCGGEIVVAETSRVAHMWRDPNVPKTALHYSIPTEHVLRNRLRAATSWMGEWAKKVRSFPEYSEFNPGGHWQLGSFENVEKYANDLQCKGFKSYLDKFQDLYSMIGGLPDKVFNLRHRRSQLCLHHELTYQSSNGGRMTLRPCNRFSEAQRWHGANADSHRQKCCSGLKLWDIDVCLAGNGVGNGMVAEACFNFGESSNQWWKLNAGGLLQFKDGEACGVPEESQPAGDAETRGGVLRGATCKAKFQTVPSESDAKKVRLVAEGTPNQCLSEGEGQTWKEQGKPLLFRPCSSGDSKQVFTIAHHYTGNSHQLKTSSGLCVDAANGAGPLAYECHNVGDDPRQQQFDVKPDSAMLWNGRTDNGDETFCIDPKPALGVLTVCAASAENVPKAGQGFKRHDEQGGFFQLRDTISGNCLTPVDGGSDGNPQVASKPCGVEDRPDDQRWSINEAGNIINKGRNLCIDSGDQVSPVFLYTCYAPGENPKQTFKIHFAAVEVEFNVDDNLDVTVLDVLPAPDDDDKLRTTTGLADAPAGS
jgi:hypothetical protein